MRRELKDISEEEILHFLGYGDAAVSYTHLDVYKRQGLYADSNMPDKGGVS